MDKIIAVIGPTSSGKSELAVHLAKKFNGEIISCDSRQIYKGMDIGTGKVTGKWLALPFAGHPDRVHPRSGSKTFVYKGILHYCIDYVNPKSQYSVSRFQKDAAKAINTVRKKGKLPILCGGTGQWIDAVVSNQKIPEVKPNVKLRRQLEKLSLAEMFWQLKRLDPDRAAVIDAHNPRRLIRALEIVITTGKPIPKLLQQQNFDVLWIGLYPGQEQLYKKIDRRLKERLDQGMVKEAQKLRKQGLSWKKLESFGLEYKYLALYLQKKLTCEEMVSQLAFAIKHYSKRQMTWFRRNEKIHWLAKPVEAALLVEKFLK
jgi:tRNA dimethylallyltransferase